MPSTKSNTESWDVEIIGEVEYRPRVSMSQLRQEVSHRPFSRNNRNSSRGKAWPNIRRQIWLFSDS